MNLAFEIPHHSVHRDRNGGRHPEGGASTGPKKRHRGGQSERAIRPRQTAACLPPLDRFRIKSIARIDSVCGIHDGRGHQFNLKEVVPASEFQAAAGRLLLGRLLGDLFFFPGFFFLAAALVGVRVDVLGTRRGRHLDLDVAVFRL